MNRRNREQRKITIPIARVYDSGGLRPAIVNGTR
jgi:hypothetical protein